MDGGEKDDALTGHDDSSFPRSTQAGLGPCQGGKRGEQPPQTVEQERQQHNHFALIRLS
jgi:hypothetical protein